MMLKGEYVQLTDERLLKGYVRLSTYLVVCCAVLHEQGRLLLTINKAASAGDLLKLIKGKFLFRVFGHDLRLLS